MAKAASKKASRRKSKKSRGKATIGKKKVQKKTALRKAKSRKKAAPAARAKKTASKTRARKSPVATVSLLDSKSEVVARCVNAVMDLRHPGWNDRDSMTQYHYDKTSMAAFLDAVRGNLRANHYNLAANDDAFTQGCVRSTVRGLKARIAARTTKVTGEATSIRPPPAAASIKAPRPPGRGRKTGAATAAPSSSAPRAGAKRAAPKRAAPRPAARRSPRPALVLPRLSHLDRDSYELEATIGTPDEATAADAPTPRPPRYANAVLLGQDSEKPIRKDANGFAPDMLVRLRLDIGKLSAESQVENPTDFPADKLQIDVDLDVMVSSTDFGVAVDAGYLAKARPGVAHGYFRLPGDGGPARTRDDKQHLFFFLKLPADAALWRSRISHARIGYYYRNILLQSQHLTVCPESKDSFSIVTDFTTSDDLTGLHVIPERTRISIITNANGNGNHQIVLRRPGEASSATDPGITLEMNSTTVGTTIGKLRKVLTDRAPVQALRNPRMFADDLRILAPIGWDLYSQLPGQVPPDFFGNLQLNPESSVIQVGRPNASSFVLPWSYMYEIPLYSGVTPTLCPMVAQWDGKQPLFSGAPRQCPCGPHARDVLCPFGFWGYRYAIEQLSSADKPVLSIAAAPNCDIVIGEAQYGLDLSKLSDHVGRLRAMLGAMPLNAQLREGKDKASIEKLLGADLPFVYFFCHGERPNMADPNTYLGVGSRQTITAQDIVGWTQGWYTTLKKLIWNAVRPLVFINACHSLAIEPETLVPYLQAFVGRGRAAGVIGTEVKVEESMAMEVAEQFVAAWMSGKQTVEEALRAIRIDYLKQGNMFGLVYTPYCWSELKIVQP